jgi:hypothetical protein
MTNPCVPRLSMKSPSFGAVLKVRSVQRLFTFEKYSMLRDRYYAIGKRSNSFAKTHVPLTWSHSIIQAEATTAVVQEHLQNL